MGQLTQKRAVILGASRPDNMGQAIARRFLQEGAQVLVSGRDGEALAQFGDSTGCQWATCDITSEAELARLAETAVDRLGGIDIALNATGWGLLKPFLDTTAEDIRRMAELQFTGAILFYQAMLRTMNDHGCLIQISSATASIMLEDHAAYMGTKAGADHVLRCVANEFGHRGIRAISLAPGFTITPMTAKASRNKTLIECFAREYPLGRVGTTDDVADAAVWVASDQCFVTGQVIQVNGGLTLRRNPRNAEIAAAVKAARAAAAAEKA